MDPMDELDGIIDSGQLKPELVFLADQIEAEVRERFPDLDDDQKARLCRYFAEIAAGCHQASGYKRWYTIAAGYLTVSRQLARR